MRFVGDVLSFLFGAYLMVLTVRAVLSLIPLIIRDWRPRGFMLVVAESTFTLTDPPLRALRTVIPPVRLGGVSWDLAFLALYVLVSLAQQLVVALLR